MRAVKFLVMSGVCAQLCGGCVDDGDPAADLVDERGYTSSSEGSSSEGGEPPDEGPAGPCRELRDADPYNVDGDYEIVVDGHSMIVTCVDMHASPKEYLTLTNIDGDANASAYGTGQNTSSPAVKTQYTKVRFDASDLTVDVTDRRFSASNGGWAEFGWSYHYSWNYAHAADCHSDWSHTGRANIDLTGTPFAVERDQFVVSGYNPAGTTTFSAGDQVVELTGGGYCGDNAPESFRLQLKWAE